MENADNKKKIRLLLVDDEEGFRKAVTRRLEKRGMVILQADSGEACLGIIDQAPLDVVVMDVKMPGLDGIETLKIIRQKNASIQVILLTGNAAVADGIEGIKVGAYDYLTKPVEIDHLVGKIRQAYALNLLKAEKEKEKRYREQLEKKMVDTERLVALGTLSTGIAHEINNPLAIINEAAGLLRMLIVKGPDTNRMGNSGNLKGLLPDEPTTGETMITDELSAWRERLLLGVDKIETAVKRAGRITHQLLGQVKKQDPGMTKVPLESLIDDALTLLIAEINQKNIRVIRQISSKASVIRSEPGRLRQVLNNLIENAVNALKSDGILTISAGLTPSTEERTVSSLILTVEDNGTGIPEENLGKIFDPFFTTKSFDQGTGLGLFVVHKIVTELNGSIEVKSAVGRGTTFKIGVPILT